MTESDLPTTSMSRSKLSRPKRRRPPIEGASPIAADGGFGPMDHEDSADESADSDVEKAKDEADPNPNEGAREDFDDFEAGGENEDFGDFDDGFQEPSISEEEPAGSEPLPSSLSLPPSASPFVSKIVIQIEKFQLLLISFTLKCA